MTAHIDIQTVLSDTLFSDIEKKRTQLLGASGRLAYYTTADTAIKLLQNGHFWMRCATVMNDHSEVNFGIDQMLKAWKSTRGKNFWAALAKIAPNLDEAVKEKFLAKESELASTTYLACLSLHKESSNYENKYGRLSMWRAYGGNSGVALILNNTIFETADASLGAVSQPVTYGTSIELAHRLATMAEGLERNRVTIMKLIQSQRITAIQLAEAVSLTLEFDAICLKHPAFKEEKEWRIMRSRSHHTAVIFEEIEIIGGIPQIVMKIPLENRPEHGLVGLSPNDLINRIMIGPTEHPSSIKQSLIKAMTVAGMQSAPERVRITNIPLRPNQR